MNKRIVPVGFIKWWTPSLTGRKYTEQNIAELFDYANNITVDMMSKFILEVIEKSGVSNEYTRFFKVYINNEKPLDTGWLHHIGTLRYPRHQPSIEDQVCEIIKQGAAFMISIIINNQAYCDHTFYTAYVYFLYAYGNPNILDKLKELETQDLVS